MHGLKIRERATRVQNYHTYTLLQKYDYSMGEGNGTLFFFDYLRFSPPLDERDPERSQISVYRYVRLRTLTFTSSTEANWRKICPAMSLPDGFD